MLAAHRAHPTKPLYHLDMASSHRWWLLAAKICKVKAKGQVNPPAQELNLAPVPEQFQVWCRLCQSASQEHVDVLFIKISPNLRRDRDFNSCWLNEHAHCLAKQIISMQFLLSHYHCRFVECLAASTARSISRKVFFLHKLVRRQLWTPAMRCKRNLEMTRGYFASVVLVRRLAKWLQKQI